MAIVATPSRKPGKLQNNASPAPIEGIAVNELPNLNKPSKLTAEEIQTMTPAQIAKNYAERKNARKKRK